MTRGAATRAAHGEPWAPQDVSHAVLLGGAGVLAEAGCWVGISGTGVLSAQLGWLVGSIAAAVLVLLAGTQFLLAGTRTVQTAQRAVMSAVLETCVPSAAPHTLTVDDPAQARGIRVAGAVMTRHHAPRCPLVLGKPVEVLDEAGVARRRPCGVCT